MIQPQIRPKGKSVSHKLALVADIMKSANLLYSLGLIDTPAHVVIIRYLDNNQDLKRYIEDTNFGAGQ